MIELLVSMALFIVVITIGIGALLVLISANVKAQNNQEAVSNIQFALDSMAREIRTGSGYYCLTSGSSDPNLASLSKETTANCAGKGAYLSIVEGGKSLTQNQSNRRISYRWRGTGAPIERKIQGQSSWVALTNPEVKIESMHFNVVNTDTKESNGNVLQPNVTIYISGRVEGVADTSSEFRLQTTVTKRVLDI